MVENINRLVNRYRPYYGRATMPLAKPRFLLRDGQLVLLPTSAQTIDDLRSIDWVEANLAPEDRWYLPGTLTSTPFDTFDTVRVTRTAVYLAAKYRILDWPLRPADVASSYILPYRQGSEAYDILLLVLTSFADRIRADGATPILVVMPPAEIIAEERDGRPKRYQPLLDEMKRHGVAVADVTDALAARAHTVPVSDLMGFQHYSPLANEIVAEELARQLPGLTRATCPAR
jgi:hypothetical protein